MQTQTKIYFLPRVVNFRLRSTPRIRDVCAWRAIARDLCYYIAYPRNGVHMLQEYRHRNWREQGREGFNRPQVAASHREQTDKPEQMSKFIAMRAVKEPFANVSKCKSTYAIRLRLRCTLGVKSPDARRDVVVLRVRKYAIRNAVRSRQYSLHSSSSSSITSAPETV
jgi:hypothetical protein